MKEKVGLAEGIARTVKTPCTAASVAVTKLSAQAAMGGSRPAWQCVRACVRRACACVCVCMCVRVCVQPCESSRARAVARPVLSENASHVVCSECRVLE